MPSAEAEAWNRAGFRVSALTPADLASREKVPAPGIAARADLASATRSPWVTANGWRFLRHRAGRFFYDVPRGQATLAAAEAFAYGADALMKIDPADLEAFAGLLAFLRRLPVSEAPAVADFGVVDDGSPLVGEVLNLLVRRNLLFRVGHAPFPEFPINVRLGSPGYPSREAADPSAFALKIRRELTDERRAIRVYGSEVVVCRLTADAGGARLQLLNYGGREIDGLRLRVRGAYARGVVHIPGLDRAPLEEVAATDGATEFSLARLGVYAVVDLDAGK